MVKSRYMQEREELVALLGVATREQVLSDAQEDMKREFPRGRPFSTGFWVWFEKWEKYGIDELINRQTSVIDRERLRGACVKARRWRDLNFRARGI